MKNSVKYFIKTDFSDEVEVTKEQFIRAEKSVGFHSKFGGDSVATGGFAAGVISGRIEFKN